MKTRQVLSMSMAIFLMLTLCGMTEGCHADTQATQAAAIAPSTPLEIDVDHTCGVRQGNLPFRRDAAVCHLESVSSSSHVEEHPSTGGMQTSRVEIAEQEFLLDDTTGSPVMFVVTYPVAHGWHVDSDPQPVATKRNMAVFRVSAQPGQIVRLHVGVRFAKPI